MIRTAFSNLRRRTASLTFSKSPPFRPARTRTASLRRHAPPAAPPASQALQDDAPGIFGNGDHAVGLGHGPADPSDEIPAGFLVRKLRMLEKKKIADGDDFPAPGGKGEGHRRMGQVEPGAAKRIQ